MTANINFINLRSAQPTIVDESTWMGGELEGLPDGERDEPLHIVEARRLVGTLNRAGHEYIDREFLALKQFAIAERSVPIYSGPDPRLIVKRLLNGLHAIVTPIDGLIRRLGDTSSDTRLSMILQAGRVQRPWQPPRLARTVPPSRLAIDSTASTRPGHPVSLCSLITFRRAAMAQLIVRDLPADLVAALKQRAAKRNRSAEQEHREILKAALHGPKRRSLADTLAAIPDVGEDSDFVREQNDR